MKNLAELKSFDALKIYLASEKDILSWSYGEVTKPETINYRTFRPEREGLFDERIFGPEKDYHCYCGKYKGYRYKGVVCDKCGVEIVSSKVRRERMAHIKLACPVVHVWFFKGIPSKMATLLDISPRNLESVIYFSSYIVVELDASKRAEAISKCETALLKIKDGFEKELHQETQKLEKLMKEQEKGKDTKFTSEELALKLKQKTQILKDSYTKKLEDAQRHFDSIKKKLEGFEKYSILSDVEYMAISDYVDMFCTVLIGAEAIKQILEGLNLSELAAQLKEELSKYKGQRALKVSKRLKVVEGFRRASIEPSRMVLTVLPVIPPELRPMVQLDGGKFASSDTNDLYRKIIHRNNRLKKLLKHMAPEIIVRNEKRMLQEAVDALIDSSKQRNKNRNLRGKKVLKSLSDQLKGKQGRFRQNLLGKRVDYSGRGVIVNGPALKLDECGIPKHMALELFKPFIIRELLARGIAPNTKSAKYIIDSQDAVVWDILEEVSTNHPVLLGRQPTLWRLGIQAFYPKLIDGNAIRLHLCVCTGFNADFDGDQMYVLLPLSEKSIEEAKTKMLSIHNLRRPSDGKPISVPSKTMLFGIYYLTFLDEALPEYPSTFGSKEEAIYAYEALKLVGLRQAIKVRLNTESLSTTVGRILFNEYLPENWEFVNKVVDKGVVETLLVKAFEQESNATVVQLIDGLKNLGLNYATVSGHSVSISDLVVPAERDQLIQQGKDAVEEVNKNYARGLSTEKEATRKIGDIWENIRLKIENSAWDALDDKNPIKVLLKSKASRASKAQVSQIAGIRGLIFDATGKVVKVPLLGNYKLGLSAMEYFIGARGARKGLVDKGLKTADAGYLTRKLVDVAQDVLIREADCGTTQGREVTVGEATLLTTFEERFAGRVLAKEVKTKAGFHLKADHILTRDNLTSIKEAGIATITLRSPYTCQTRRGLCQKCYGTDVMTDKTVQLGTAVGIAAAQAIGEPGTQLTMRTFHTGGVAGKDITQGLPRIEEIVEARMPKYMATMAQLDGIAKLAETGDERKIVVFSEEKGDSKMAEYYIDPVDEIIVQDGQKVTRGQKLTSGHLNLSDIMATIGMDATKKYILDEIVSVYASQGVNINDKHLEVIISQMFNHVIIEYPNDTSFLSGELVTKASFHEENDRVIAAGGVPATGHATLLGITKASLNTDSFLSAASFIQTSQVLTDAAASGKVDMLLGLKENVIIGRLIPTGENAGLE